MLLKNNNKNFNIRNNMALENAYRCYYAQFSHRKLVHNVDFNTNGLTYDILCVKLKLKNTIFGGRSRCSVKFFSLT